MYLCTSKILLCDTGSYEFTLRSQANFNTYVHFCQFKACATSPGCEIQDYPGGIQFHATDLTLAPKTRGLMPLAHRKGF